VRRDGESDLEIEVKRLRAETKRLRAENKRLRAEQNSTPPLRRGLVKARDNAMIAPLGGETDEEARWRYEGGW